MWVLEFVLGSCPHGQVGVTLWGCPALVGAELGTVAVLGGIVGT